MGGLLNSRGVFWVGVSVFVAKLIPFAMPGCYLMDNDIDGVTTTVFDRLNG